MKITDQEIQLAKFCIEIATKEGASAARASLSKAVTDSYASLDGALDKVTHAADRSIYLHLFVDGRYGTYSTNKLDEDELRLFVRQAVDATRLLAPDENRHLPAKELCLNQKTDGTEAGLYDQAYENVSAEDRLRWSAATAGTRLEDGENYSIVSVETEYADNLDDNYIVDSQGFEARHTETFFSMCSEVTIQDKEGHRYSAYWWEASPFLANMNPDSEDSLFLSCPRTALKRAIDQLNPGKTRSGKRTMVVDRTVSSRLIGPIISALYGAAIQQKNSFLCDSLGKKIFSEGFTLMDAATRKGYCGARLFDTEGVATKERSIIENGTVNMYFIDTYISGKLGMEQTVEGPSVPMLMPYPCNITGNEINLQRILKECGSGILVTGFNGGNCNQTTGDFSYGVEGFTFSRGKIVRPVHELVVTGNMKELWNSLIMAGNDSRRSARWQIPTLAFKDVNFSA